MGGPGRARGLTREGADYGGGCGGVAGSRVHNEYRLDRDSRHLVIPSLKAAAGDVANDDIGGVAAFDPLNLELLRDIINAGDESGIAVVLRSCDPGPAGGHSADAAEEQGEGGREIHGESWEDGCWVAKR